MNEEKNVHSNYTAKSRGLRSLSLPSGQDGELCGLKGQAQNGQNQRGRSSARSPGQLQKFCRIIPTSVLYVRAREQLVPALTTSRG